MDVERITLPEQHYLYAARECAYGPEIGEAMGSAFGEVMGLFGAKGITPLAHPMSVYLGMDPKILRFRGGMIVSVEDAAKAEGGVEAATLPAGEAMKTLHVGPYDTMNQTHQALWKHMEAEGIPGAFPIWEIYIDDPHEVAPDKLRTEIYRAIG